MYSRSLLVGAYEIKHPYQKNLAISFGIAGMLQITIVLLIIMLFPMKPLAPTPIDPNHPVDITRIIPPVVGITPITPDNALSHPKALPKIGIPMPVADSLATSDNTIRTMDDLRNLAPETPISVLDGNAIINTGLIIDSLLPLRGSFVPFDDPPVSVNSVLPEYPDLARRTGLEGIVWLEVLIDKDGAVRDVSVVKCNNENMGFEEAATNAAWKSVWKPAISNGLPIAVRVTYAVAFKLK
jgi:TonB family protein